ncbi:hypothetical protein JCM11491_002868 [Sporobolomyces phaffii]
MATTMLNHVLSHHLATNDAVPACVDYLEAVLESHRLIAATEQDEGTNGPTLHRWQLRLVSLLSASNPSAVRAAGFRLLHRTVTSSATVFLAASKPALASATQVLATPVAKLDPALYLAALELSKLVIAKSTYYPEWARENVGAQAVQKFVSASVRAVHESPILDIKLASLSTMCTLLPLFPTALRPLSPSLHALSLSVLCDAASPRALVQHASNLFVSLYLLAPKGKEGLREAWRTGVEALVASCDQLTSIVTAGIFAEDALTNHSLSPLALPPLEGDHGSPFAALARLETLTLVLLETLRTPTTDRAGPVAVPLGAIVELGVRLVSFTSQSPVRDRVDPSVHTLTMTFVPKLETLGCRVLAQLALAVGTNLVGFAGVVLGAVARTLSTYEVRSPMRPALSTTYALLVNAMSSHVDPNEASKSLSRVWRTVLEDISAVALEPSNCDVTTSETGKAAAGRHEGGGGGGGRKNKRVKTSFDPTESMVHVRAAVDERDLEIAIKGLETLERLLRAPLSQFLPPALQLSTSRLLLYLSLSPSFSTTSPVSSRVSSSTFYPAMAGAATTTTTRLEVVAQHSPAFARAVLAALATSVAFGIGGTGTDERAVFVWDRESVESTGCGVRAVAHEALARLGEVAHPCVPVAVETETVARARRDRHGGDVGYDEDAWRDGIDEFRRTDPTVGPYKAHADEDDEDSADEEMMRDDEGGDEDERKRKQQPPPPPAVKNIEGSASFGVSTATAAGGGGGGGSGFALFQAPTFGATPTTTTMAAAVPSAASGPTAAPRREEDDDERRPSAIPVLSFSTETSMSNKPAPERVTSTTTTKRQGTRQNDAGDDDDDEDSDDDMMPAIDMGSDRE